MRSVCAVGLLVAVGWGARIVEGGGTSQAVGEGCGCGAVMNCWFHGVMVPRMEV